jgi:hypothetical protein
VLALPNLLIEFVWSGTAWDTNQRHAMPYQPMRSIVANTTLTHEDFGKLCLVGSGTTDITVVLPTATGRQGAVIGVKHGGTAGATITIDPQGAQQIQGEDTYELTAPDQTYPSLTPDSENTWTENQYFFEASLIEYEQTLTFGASIAWDLDEGNHAKVGITGNCTFAAATNKHVGQNGFLRLIGLAAADLTWDTSFAWVGTEVESVVNNEVVIVGYFVAASNLIYLWNVTGGQQAADLATPGEIGAWAFLASGSAYTPGTTLAGGSLNYASIGANVDGSDVELDLGSSPSGTWKAFGTSDGSRIRASLFQRIS